MQCWCPEGAAPTRVLPAVPPLLRAVSSHVLVVLVVLVWCFRSHSLVSLVEQRQQVCQHRRVLAA